MSQNRTLRFLLFGKIRFDDDSVGNNTIPGMEFFDSDVTFDGVTSTCTLWRGTRRGTVIEVIDCMDLFDAERTEEEVTTDVVQAVACMHPGPLTFVYVVMVSDLYTEEEKHVYEMLKVLLGPDVTEYTIILLLTCGDGRDRKRTSLHDVLSTAPDQVHKVLEECGHRYVVFNNRQSQVEDLIEAVHKLSEKHGGKDFSCSKNSEIGERIESEVASRKQQEMKEKSKQDQKELAEREKREEERMEKERDEQTRKDKDRITQLEAMVETLKQQQLDSERMHEKEMKCRLKEMERKTKEEMLTLEKKQRDMERQRKEETTALEQKNQELQQMQERRLEMERSKLQEAERQKCEMEKEMARRLQEVDVEEVKRKRHVQEMEEKIKKAQEEMEKQKREFERREKERDETMKRKEMARSKQLEMETLKLQRLTDERLHQAEMDFRRKVDEEVRKEMERRIVKELVAPGESLRFLLVGGCGSGRSSTGNTILGMKLFDISRGLEFCTKTCCLKRGTRSGINMEVMDTPGLLDYMRKQEEVEREIIQGVARMQPGPTAVLHIVHSGRRYTREEHSVYERLKALLGPRVTDHMIVIFTHGDELKWSKMTIQEALSAASPDLRKVLDECGHRYVVFDNTANDTLSQVEDLLEKVRQLKKKINWMAYTLPRRWCAAWTDHRRAVPTSDTKWSQSSSKCVVSVTNIASGYERNRK